MGEWLPATETIKSRDFWMPFAPSVLRERSSTYMRKPKPMDAPYMVITFDSEPAAREACRATMHPQDFTLRPQEVDAGTNPSYHALLTEYERRTGHGLVLNTSFNLHGEPLVYKITQIPLAFKDLAPGLYGDQFPDVGKDRPGYQGALCSGQIPVCVLGSHRYNLPDRILRPAFG